MEKLIFVIDDEKSVTKLITHWVNVKWKHRVETFDNGEDALKKLSMNPNLILLDIMLPNVDGIEILKRIKQYDENLPVIMLSAQGSIEVAVEALRLGAYDYFPKPMDMPRLEQIVKNAIQSYDLLNELKLIKENAKKEYSFDNVVSADNKMQEVLKMVSKVLDNDITVLINGESGTGKEVIAQAIHYNGIRKDKPFVVVNCASIPRELLESELFGHEKGAFTGAYQRKIGKFEVAKEGTIFLDEVGELHMALQAKLLRVIQNKEFERVGGTEVIKTDVRIISATNKDLKLAVEEKEFREDLYYRLSSYPIYIPPLRERKGDILVLIEHFIARANKKLNRQIKGFTKKALKYIYEYEWPGNIRELENTIERCIILSESDLIDVDAIPSHIKAADGGALALKSSELFSDDTIIPFEKLKMEAIKHAIKVTDGNILESAKRLHIGRATLYRLMEKYSIPNRVKE